MNVFSSATKAVSVTPSNTTVITMTKGIYIGGSGDLVVTMQDGADATFKALSAGAIHPIAVTKVKATGTTATDILAVY